MVRPVGFPTHHEPWTRPNDAILKLVVAVKPCLALLLLIPAFCRADSVYLDDSFAEEVRPTLQRLSDDVWDIVQRMYHSQPPLDLPIYIHHSDAESPLTTLDDPDHPTEIHIRITSNGTYYAQFAYQLGHELGHVMLDPRRANGIIETLCNATSYEVLDRLGDRVSISDAYSWLSDYAPHFREYREDDEKETLNEFPAEVRAMVEQSRWSDLADYLHQHLGEMEPHQPNERAVQTLAAIALRSGPVEWGAFAGLAACTTPTPEQEPEFEILPVNPDCLERVSDLLRRFGMQPASTAGQ